MSPQGLFVPGVPSFGSKGHLGFLGAASGGGGGPPPWIIDEQFTTGTYFPRAIDLELVDTRASTKYVTDGSGSLTLIAANALPISSAGMLVEPAATNRALNSEALSNASYWGTANATVTAGQADPAGGTNAVLVNEGVAASVIHQFTTAAGGNVTVSAGTTYVQSVYAKAGTKSLIQLTFGAGAFSGLGFVNFDLSAGTIVGSGGALAGSGIQNVGGVWFRCWMAAAATASATTTAVVVFGIPSAASPRAPTYTGTNGTYTVAFPQMEVGSSPSSYITTTTVAVTRAADAITVQRTGLGRVVFTFDDASQQTVSGIDTGAQYVIPTNLTRPLITRMTGYAA